MVIDSLIIQHEERTSVGLIHYNHTIKQKRMNKNCSSSYQCFRRKNSLHSNDQELSHSSFDPNQSKLQSNNNLLQIESLSLQIDNIRNRSLSSRKCTDHHTPNVNSLKRNSSSHMFINTSYIGNDEPLNFSLPYRYASKCVKTEGNNPREENDKINKVSFNQFQIIEEDNKSNEDESFDAIKTTVQLHTHRVPAKKIVSIKSNTMKRAPIASKPVPVNKYDNQLHKKQKKGTVFSELQKMQKQLDNHRVIKEPTSTWKSNLNTNILKREKEPINKDIQNVKKTVICLPQNKVNTELKSNRGSIKAVTCFTESKVSLNRASHMLLSQKKLAKGHQKQEMEATRMISTKQKQSLISKLLSLKDIIQKNQICSTNMPQIQINLLKLQQQLTN